MSTQNRKAAKALDVVVEAPIRVQHLMGDTLGVTHEPITVPSFPAFHKHLCNDFAAVLRLPIDKVRFWVCFFGVRGVIWGPCPCLGPFFCSVHPGPYFHC